MPLLSRFKKNKRNPILEIMTSSQMIWIIGGQFHGSKAVKEDPFLSLLFDVTDGCVSVIFMTLLND